MEKKTHINEIDKRISDTVDQSVIGKNDQRWLNLLALIAEVDTQVHEVVTTKAGLINVLLQLNLGDLVGNVSQHDLPMLVWQQRFFGTTHTVVRTSTPNLMLSSSTTLWLPLVFGWLRR